MSNPCNELVTEVWSWIWINNRQTAKLGYPAEVTVGLASHWPCVADSIVLPTYMLNGQCQGDEHRLHCFRSMAVRHIWSICAFNQMHCKSSKCVFDQTLTMTLTLTLTPTLILTPNRNPIPNRNPTLNFISTKCRACMQVG